MHSMTARWIPPNERSKFVTAYLGSSVGTAVFYPIFGYILTYLSWEWVFHLSAVLGTIWYICWMYFVYDTPAHHPRIDPQERAYIETAIGDTCKVTEKVCPIESCCTMHAHIDDFIIVTIFPLISRIKHLGVRYSHRALCG